LGLCVTIAKHQKNIFDIEVQVLESAAFSAQDRMAASLRGRPQGERSCASTFLNTVFVSFNLRVVLSRLEFFSLPRVLPYRC
jgi:hypothetical protein